MSDAGKVVPLREGPIGIAPGDPVNHSVVAVLEKHLAAAKRGEIDGIALAISHPNDTIVSDWSSAAAGAAFRLAAAVMLLQAEYADRMKANGP